VSFIRGDILNEAHLYNACCDRDVVFHTAAMLNYWSRLQHDFELVNKVNYVGTKNIIEACHKTGVKKLLFPSSASIFVTSGTRPAYVVLAPIISLP
jgi:nucleoside-diphosphate-sugar epimerase